MPIVFRAKTTEGYQIKTLVELIQTNIKTGCFELDKNGIFLRMMDSHRTILLDLEMSSDNFSPYKCEIEDRLSIGINMTHFHKMLKPIKKKDSLELYIDSKSMTDLGIKIIPKDNSRTTLCGVKIQNIQNLDISLPDGYDKPIIVPSGEFQKMCKGLSQISDVTKIISRGSMIKFASDAGGVMKRSTEFGERDKDDVSNDDTGDDDDDEDDDEKDDDEENADYCEEFDTEQLTKITKLSGLSPNMQIYAKTDNPLMFRSQIGGLGTIAIYLKSKKLQETESHAVEAEVEDD